MDNLTEEEAELHLKKIDEYLYALGLSAFKKEMDREKQEAKNG